MEKDKKNPGKNPTERLDEEELEEPTEEIGEEELEKSTEEIGEEELEEPTEEIGEEELEKSTEEIGEEELEKSTEEIGEEELEKSTEEIGEEELEKSTEEIGEEELEEPTEEIGEEELEEPTEEIDEEELEEPTEEIGEEELEKPTEEIGEEEIKDCSKENEEVSKEKPIARFIKKRKKVIIGIAISVCTLLVIYLCMVGYYTDHFYFNSEINGINVSGKTLEEVKEVMASEIRSYTLNIKERGGKVEEVKADEVGLRYTSEDDFKSFKDSQNPFKWITSRLTKEEHKIDVGFIYDEKLLKERIDNLSCFNSNNIIKPKNPNFKYDNNSYIIVEEVPGNQVDKDILYSHVIDSILNEETELDLELVGCYVKPEYNSKSKKIIETKNTLNKYVSSKITYTSGNRKEVVDGSIINKWIIVGEDYEVTFDEEKVKEYIDGLAKKFNTVGTARTFTTSSGKTIKVGRGDYGKAINKTKEIESLIVAIKEGKIITKEPIYSQNTYSKGSSDIGNTYVEIDLTKQHIWFYKNGNLIVHGNIVTGNVKAGHTTPKGIYKLKYKAKNVVLRGADYAAPVTYWMPFNGGIGIHDANWRSTFGGDIYKTNGSHGCINSPYNVAEGIYNNIKVGTPVICY